MNCLEHSHPGHQFLVLSRVLFLEAAGPAHLRSCIPQALRSNPEDLPPNKGSWSTTEQSSLYSHSPHLTPQESRKHRAMLSTQVTSCLCGGRIWFALQGLGGDLPELPLSSSLAFPSDLGQNPGLLWGLLFLIYKIRQMDPKASPWFSLYNSVIVPSSSLRHVGTITHSDLTPNKFLVTSEATLSSLPACCPLDLSSCIFWKLLSACFYQSLDLRRLVLTGSWILHA